MSYYKMGIISVAEGSDVVVGLGTAWVDNVRVGDMIRLPNGQQHEILARGSDTLLSIFPAYSGPSASGQPYFVVPVPGYGKKLYDELALAVRQFGDGAAKLEGVAAGATKNSADEYLLDRKNHTGAQAAETVEGLSDALQKLAGVATGATKNQTDTYLRSRENHTGTQALSTITGTGTAAAMNAVGTGGIIEYGTNANGEYRRFADGTQICTHAVPLVFDNANNIGATWIFPAAFVGKKPFVSHNLDRNGASLPAISKAFVIQAYAIELTLLAIACFGSGAFVSTDFQGNLMQLTAIGRWK